MRSYHTPVFSPHPIDGHSRLPPENLLLFPWVLVTLLVVSCLLQLCRTAKAAGLSLPPGPESFWFRRLKLPTSYPWLVYAKWKEIYGDVIYIHVLGNPLIVLNSVEALSDLLEKRGNIYSSRPVRPMVVDLMGWDWLVSSMPYGERWKRHRNLFHKHFKPSDSLQCHFLQIKETHALLRDLLRSPKDFRYHVRRSAAAIVLNLTYGHQVAEQGDEYVNMVDKAVSGLAQAGIFGTYMVDYFPILRHLPSWLPFVTFKRQALVWRRTTRALVNHPYDVVKQQMSKGTASPCLVTRELEEEGPCRDQEDEQTVKNVAATAFTAGAETVVSGILSFFLVMAIHPEIQCRAQNELDRVIGNSRLPLLSDRIDLPYIESLCYELLRWNPVTPLGLAHYVTQDDEYRGYHIPKGTTILPNVWAVLHDPKTYPDPLAFKADRFMDQSANTQAGINEKPDVVFGFGRRVCPGRWLALDFTFTVVASLLAVYDISKETDEAGRPIEPEIEYTSLLLSHPKPFRCRITPRSRSAMYLIEQTAE